MASGVSVESAAIQGGIACCKTSILRILSAFLSFEAVRLFTSYVQHTLLRCYSSCFFGDGSRICSVEGVRKKSTFAFKVSIIRASFLSFARSS